MLKKWKLRTVRPFCFLRPIFWILFFNLVLGSKVLGGEPLKRNKCSALLASRSLLNFEGRISSQKKFVGFLDLIIYRIWNKKLSSVAIKNLIDRDHFGADRIMIGAALVIEDLMTHYHSASEIYYVLKGRGKIILGSGEEKIQMDLEPGRFIYLPPNIAHYTVVDSKDPLEIIYIFPRSHLDEVKYRLDEKKANFEEIGLLERVVIGDIPHLRPKQRVHERLVERREKGERGLMMERSVLLSKDSIQGIGFSHIFFVRQGHGFIRIGEGERVPLRPGAYAYVKKGESYFIESLSQEGLDILSFRSLPEK